MSEAAKQLTLSTPANLLVLAVENNADVDRLEKLMDLQERWERNEARKAYFDALSDFQSDCPSIPKTKTVKNKDGTPRYKYAPLDSIISVLREPLKKHGFSYRWQTSHLEEMLIVTCFLTHRMGHEESVEVRIPGITGHGTNAAQDEGSAISYGKRYSLSNILGIQPDDDDDGQASGPNTALRLIQMMNTLRNPDVLASVMDIKENLSEGGDKTKAAESYACLTKAELMDLNVATQKGGIWTVEERKTTTRDQEFQQMVYNIRKDNGWYDNPENAN